MVKIFSPVFDGGKIDVLWDHYETAINWYEKYLGLKVEQKEDWKPDPRVLQGKKTHIGLGLWLDTYITQKKAALPFC